jgi:hypothetical protein
VEEARPASLRAYRPLAELSVQVSRWSSYLPTQNSEEPDNGGVMTFPTSHVLGAQRNGVNHVSMNLGSFDLAKGPVRGTDYPVYFDALLDWYQAKGVSSVRLVFTWEAVQAPPLGPTAPVPAAGVNYAGYWNDLMDVVKRLLSRGIFVTLALWQYNPAAGDTDIVYDGSSFTADNFSDFWGKFATAVNAATGNDLRISFDLINEPHTHEQSGNRPGDIGIDLGVWFALAQAAISAIRAAGATNTIFVPGMSYSDANAFTTNGSANAWLALTDPSNNIAVTAHNYNGLGTTEPTALSAACGEVVAWARTHGVKVQIAEIAIDAGDNGQPPFAGNLPAAEAQWADWQQFCLTNRDVLVGWHWWGNSAKGSWDAGDSQNGQHWGLTLDDGASQTVYADLIAETLRTPRQPDPDRACTNFGRGCAL